MLICRYPTACNNLRHTRLGEARRAAATLARTTSLRRDVLGGGDVQRQAALM